jgi:hypothetical protein
MSASAIAHARTFCPGLRGAGVLKMGMRAAVAHAVIPVTLLESSVDVLG